MASPAAAFVAVAPAAGAAWTIGTRAAVSGVTYAGSSIGDLGSQLIHNAVNDGPDQEINIWRSLAVGAIAAGLQPKLPPGCGRTKSSN